LFSIIIISIPKIFRWQFKRLVNDFHSYIKKIKDSFEADQYIEIFKQKQTHLYDLNKYLKILYDLYNLYKSFNFQDENKDFFDFIVNWTRECDLYKNFYDFYNELKSYIKTQEIKNSFITKIKKLFYILLLIKKQENYNSIKMLFLNIYTIINKCFVFFHQYKTDIENQMKDEQGFINFFSNFIKDNYIYQEQLRNLIKRIYNSENLENINIEDIKIFVLNFIENNLWAENNLDNLFNIYKKNNSFFEVISYIIYDSLLTNDDLKMSQHLKIKVKEMFQSFLAELKKKFETDKLLINLKNFYQLLEEIEKIDESYKNYRIFIGIFLCLMEEEY
jgi:hypothetical protein